ncbi:hypothetical protein UFOVP1082_41 [uncultured Caudovirales phage]|uniref:Uncharacterized protein n=1 Tax=uncultured Caudovirales phage TaxID=2100421 RepID=A0A6J5QRQ4_9CAUD|nr:hypothetical protein UFOVP906_19 [uncultured Caudovirales phage]CAB4176605.1 hypothetical protein UFOVP992_45 [uncultured Caudovirales phage]CAB4183425.1 hypothetical protein UFOVP1082_41 [uncultured Caudovirales phage]CAB4197510.1 hypothetical protein UFOVP1322_26 [uncultured Caudovirales phage]CAB4212880.1 hypothetical protein UFOVP1434_48 [uncultured Caudovirales phage]
MTTDLMFPTQLWPDEETIVLEDNGTNIFQPTFGGAVTQRTQGAEPKMVVKQTYRSLNADQRIQLQSFVSQTQGRFKSFWLSPSRYANVGSWAPTEVFTNNLFVNSTTGWIGNPATLSSIPGGLRLRNTKNAGKSDFSLYQNIAISTIDIYALRAFVKIPNFASTSSSQNGNFANCFYPVNKYVTGAYGMFDNIALASSGTSYVVYPWVTDAQGIATKANDYIDIQYASLARALMIDGKQNMLIYSEAINSGWASLSVTNSINTAIDPTGSTLGDSMLETNTVGANAHGYYQNVAVDSGILDVTMSASFKQGLHATKARVYLENPVGFDSAYTDVEFSTGSTTLGSVGTSWTHIRTCVCSEGNGWWRAGISARKVSSSASVNAFMMLSNTAGAFNYAGTGSGYIYVYGPSFSKSPVPIGYTSTSTAAYVGASPTSDLISVKGGPLGVLGAIKEGQIVEIGGELKTIVSDVDFDACGRGTLKIRPSLFRSPAIDSAVHVTRPFGRFVLRNAPEVINKLGRYIDVTLEMEEVYE